MPDLMDHAYVEEHGLVESYLKDRLDESERTAFEAHYFECETCIEQLETASDFRDGMLQVAAEGTVRATGLLAGLALLSRRRRLAWGGALLLLLALPLGLLMARNRGLERQLAEARTTAPAPGDDRRIASLEAELRSLRQTGAGDRSRLEEELAKERQARAAAETAAEKTAGRPQVNVPVFLLAAVRSGEEAGREPVNRVSLPAAAESVVFTLELATLDFPSYRAILQDKGGREIWQAGGLRPDSRDALVLLLPARMLPAGDYRLTIEGVKSGGKGFAVADHPFRVVR